MATEAGTGPAGSRTQQSKPTIMERRHSAAAMTLTTVPEPKEHASQKLGYLRPSYGRPQKKAAIEQRATLLGKKRKEA